MAITYGFGVFVEVRLTGACREHLGPVRDQSVGVCTLFVKMW